MVSPVITLVPSPQTCWLTSWLLIVRVSPDLHAGVRSWNPVIWYYIIHADQTLETEKYHGQTDARWCLRNGDVDTVTAQECSNLNETVHQPEQERQMMMIQLNTDQLTAHHQHVQTNLFPLLCLSIELRQQLLVWSLPGLRLGLRLEIQSESRVASSYPAMVLSSSQPVQSHQNLPSHNYLSILINKTGLHTIPGSTSLLAELQPSWLAWETWAAGNL